jgi:hypothetical protein
LLVCLDGSVFLDIGYLMCVKVIFVPDCDDLSVGR